MNEVVKKFSGLALASVSRGRSRAATTQLSNSIINRHFTNSSALQNQLSYSPAITSLAHRSRVLSQDAYYLNHASSFSTKIDIGQDGDANSSDVTMDGNLLTDASGNQYGVFLDTRKLPKLKPSIVKRRIDRLKTYIGTEKEIRQSPWKLNRVCQLAAGLTLEEAITQLKFCDIKNSDLLSKILVRTSNLADIRDGLQMSQLEVAECFTTKGMMLKRIKTMGRGRNGIMHHKFSHVRVVLREIDFKLKIFQAKSLGQKKKWLQHQMRAEKDAEEAKAKRDELDRLLKKQEAQQEKRRAEEKK